MERFFPDPAAKPVDLGPAAQHQVHGRIVLGPSAEMRITSQRPRPPESGRMVVRPWHRHEDGTWWPHRGSPGISVPAKDARAFLAAVTAAVAQLEQDEHARGGT